jgi:hypothetical protein
MNKLTIFPLVPRQFVEVLLQFVNVRAVVDTLALRNKRGDL